MLESLDQHDWVNLSHAYGSAADVPDLLRSLRSTDDAVRRDALWTLHGSVFHQGSRYEASSHVVPFLFDLVLDPATPDRHQLVYFLVSLAFGFESEYLPFGATRDDLLGAGQEPDEIATYDAVAAQITSLAPLVGEQNGDSVCMAAAYALAWFPAQSRSFADDIRRVYASVSREETRVSLLLSYAMLSGDASRELLAGVFDSSTGVTRAAAAAGLAVAGRGDDVVVRALLDGLALAADRGELAIPWNEGDFEGYLAIVAAHLADGREETVVGELISALQRAKGMARMAITGSILRVVAPSPMEDPRTLTPLQRRALAAIADHGLWKIGDAIFANYANLVRSFGPPGDEQALRRFLSVAEAAARGESVVWPPPQPARRRHLSRDVVEIAWPMALLFGSALIVWIVLLCVDRGFAPSTPFGWGTLLVVIAGLGVAVFAIRRGH